MHTEDVDLLVIGWGKGGKTLAGRVGRAGRRVALVERDPGMVGGACINVACVPTKALVHDAAARRPDDDPQRWFTDAVARRDRLTAAMRTRNHELLDTVDSVLLVSGAARFVGPREVEVTGGEDRLRITARHVVVNTGSVPALPRVGGAVVGGRVHDSTSVQHVSPLPGRLVVVGAGYVGLELASAFAHFGSAVTVLGRGPRPLRQEDDDVAEVVVETLEDAGVRFVTGADVERIEDEPGEPVARVRCTVAGETGTVEGDAVLLAVGRRPMTDGLDLDAAGVRTDDDGHVVVDDRLRTSADGVFAVGDVKGPPYFTYVSMDDHRVVADQVLGTGERSTTGREATLPSVVFLTPPLARVGLTERAARKQGRDVLVAARRVADVAAMPRPKIEGDARGIVKVVVDACTREVLGAALMHVGSTEVINLVAMAMRHGVTADELRDGVYTHPSATEALNEVLTALR